MKSRRLRRLYVRQVLIIGTKPAATDVMAMEVALLRWRDRDENPRDDRQTVT